MHHSILGNPGNIFVEVTIKRVHWMRFGLFVGICLWASLSNAFERTYGGVSDDEGRDTEETQDGGYILLGMTASFGAGGEDFYLVKTDSSGDTLWTKTYGGNQADRGYSLKKTPDGGFILFGETRSYGAGQEDFYLIKTDSLGDTLWTKTFGDTNQDRGRCVQRTADGGYILFGMTRSFGAGAWDCYLIKTDSLGGTLWTKTYGGSGADRGYSVQETQDGGYILAGTTASIGSGLDDLYLIKTNPSGDTLWTRAYGGSNNDEGRSVQELSSGEYVILGFTQSFGAGGFDFYWVKINTSGDTLWTRTYGGILDDEGFSIDETEENGIFILTGRTSSFGAGGSDVYLIKIDSNGDTLWTKTFGGILDDYGYSVEETESDKFIIGGYTSSYGAGGRDLYLIGTVIDHDGGVVTLNSPRDTVFTDSTYSVQAMIRNFGEVSETFDVIATIGSYSDTVQVLNLLPDSSLQVTFADWTVPPSDSTLYTMSVCTQVSLDRDTTNDCTSKPIFAYTYRFEDIGVTTLQGLPDTVLTDSTYTPQAWIKNFGNLTSTVIGVIATIDSYSDTQTVLSLLPGDSTLVTFQNWTVPSPDSTTYLFTVCTNVVGDEYTTNDCREKMIFAYTSVGVEESDFRFPISDFQLFQNHPNPFHSTTLVLYRIPMSNVKYPMTNIRLSIYDITGRLVETLVNEPQKPGVYQLPISSHQLPRSGIFFYRLESGDFIATRKLILLR